LVIANQMEFLNCGPSYFLPYQRSNLSRFTTCTFTSDAGFGFGSLLSHVFLVGVNNLRFQFCDFNGYGLPASSLEWAIYGLGSGFSVLNCTMEGYDVGVLASHPGIFFPPFCRVSGCHFKNNAIGISSWGVDGIIVEDNSFENIGGHALAHGVTVHRGLELRDCTGFRVEDNHFTGTTNGTSNTIGILTYNSKTQSNLIRRNDFSGLNVANQAEKINASTIPPPTGLEYWCNENLGDNTYDFFVAPGGNIASSQGNGNGAKNFFSLNDNNPASDFNNEGDEAITYFHLNNVPEIPISYFGIVRQLVDLGVDCGETIGETPVPVPIPHPLPSELKDLLTVEFEKADFSFDSLSAVYLNLLDGGDTEDLLSEVSNANQSTAGQVKQHLLSLSPYVTGTAL
jgi:hypothetical protein